MVTKFQINVLVRRGYFATYCVNSLVAIPPAEYGSYNHTRRVTNFAGAHSSTLGSCARKHVANSRTSSKSKTPCTSK